MKQEVKETKPRIGIVNLERRGYPRFSVDLPIEYYRDNSLNNLTGRTINASGNGLLVYLPEPLDLGQHLRMKLFFSSGTGLNAIEMLTEVVWVDIHLEKNWGDYRTGVRLIDISQEDLKKLNDFLVSLSH